MTRIEIHNRLVHILYTHPEWLNIPENLILQKAKEIDLYKFGKIMTAPDLYFKTPDTDFYYEVKTSNSPLCHKTGHDQINKIYNWLAHYKIDKKTYVGLIMPKETLHEMPTRQTLDDLVIYPY